MKLAERGLAQDTIRMWNDLKERFVRVDDHMQAHEAWSYERMRLKALAMHATGHGEKVEAIVIGGGIPSADTRGFTAGHKEWKDSPTLRALLREMVDRYAD